MTLGRTILFLCACMIVLGLSVLGAAAPVYAQDHAPNATDLAAISPTLAQQFAQESGPVSFLVILDDQLDVDALVTDSFVTSQRLGNTDSRVIKADAIYRGLSAHASRTQAPLRAWLNAQGIDYQPFYIVNMIEVHGDARLAQALRQRPEVDRLAANPAVRAQLSDNNQPGWLRTWTGSQPQATAALPWGLTYTNADDLWALGHKGQGIVISSQDTGVLWDHNALKATYRGWFTDTQTVDHVYNWFDAWGASGRPARCSSDPQVPCDDLSHGTHTVGTMMGDGTSDGYTRLGMAPDATWIGCRNMRNGIGFPTTFAACFQFSLAPYPQNGDPFVDGRPDLGAHIISNSWACSIADGCDLASMYTPVEVARAAGQFVVAAAGNDGSGCATIMHSVGLFDNVFTIGAHNVGGYIAGFSSRGPVTVDGSGRLKPDISAPGVSVFSASGQLPDRYVNASGTSMATPHVAGAVALLWSAIPMLVGEIDLTEQALLKTATPAPVSDCSGGITAISPNNLYGFGRMDALAAVQMAQSPGSVAATLLDLLDQPVTNQTVMLTDMETGYLFEVQTDGNGVALLPMVLAGDYTLSVAAAGTGFPDTPVTVGPNEDVQIALQPTVDYAMKVELVSDEPARVGGQVEFAIQITNTGTVTLTTMTLTNTVGSHFLGYLASAPAANAVTVDGAGMGRLRWDDLTASFNRDLAPGARYDLLLTFDAAQDTSALIPAGSTESRATVANVWADPGDSSGAIAITTTKSANAGATILAPTAVVIGDHDVSLADDQVAIRWVTVDEQGLLGFHLHRRVDNNGWIPLTSQLIPVAAPNPAQGHAYSYADPVDAAVANGAQRQYALEIFRVDGTTSWFELGTAGLGVEIYLPLIQRR